MWGEYFSHWNNRKYKNIFFSSKICILEFRKLSKYFKFACRRSHHKLVMASNFVLLEIVFAWWGTLKLYRMYNRVVTNVSIVYGISLHSYKSVMHKNGSRDALWYENHSCKQTSELKIDWGVGFSHMQIWSILKVVEILKCRF